mgnify:CR=1 FL=1
MNYLANIHYTVFISNMSSQASSKGEPSSGSATDDTKRKASIEETEQEENGDKKKGANKRKKAKVDLVYTDRVLGYRIS